MEKSTANLVDTKKHDTPLNSIALVLPCLSSRDPRTPLRAGAWGAFPNLLSYIRGINSLTEFTP